MSGKHHQYGPSTLDSLSLCVRYKRKPCEESSDEGTDLHRAAETNNLIGLDEEQSRCVQAVLCYSESLKYEDGAKPEDWLDMKEAKVGLEGLTFGTADRILFNLNTGLLNVIDYKFTRIASAHHQQLKTYAAAFIESHPELCVKHVRLHVAAPRLGEPEVFEHADPAALLAEVRAEIEALYARVEDPFEPPEPHEELCAKCARAARCPALGKVAVRAAKGLGLPVPETFAPDSLVSDRDRAIAQVLASVFETWAEQVKQNNSTFVSQGGEIPGFRLTTRSLGLRIPKDKTAAALAAMEERLPGVDKGHLLSCCSITVGDLVKLVALVSGTPEPEAKEYVRQSLDGIVVEGSCSFLQKEKRIADGALLDRLIG